jgi:hypothetical protein
MEAFAERCLTSVNAARTSNGIGVLSLEPSYCDAATSEAEERIAEDSASLEETEDEHAVHYRKIGLLDAKYAILASGTRLGLLPPGMDTSSGIAATEDLEGKITQAAMDVFTAILVSPSVIHIVEDARLTHMGVGIAANSEGALRLVFMFISRWVEVRGLDETVAVTRGCVVASARAMQAAPRDSDIAPGTFQAVALPTQPTAAILGARVYLDAVALGQVPASSLTELEEIPREVPAADLANITAFLRTFAHEGEATVPDSQPVATIWPWQLSHQDEGHMSIPVPISSAHADAAVMNAALQDGLPHRYVVDFLARDVPPGTREATPEESKWEDIPYDAPSAQAEELLMVHESPRPAVFVAARMVVIYTHDLAAGDTESADAIAASASDASRAAATPEFKLPPGVTATFGAFSEVTIATGSSTTAPGFRLQRLEAQLDSSSSLTSFLPLLLATADAPSLTHVKSLMLVVGTTPAQAYENAPANYDIIPVNIAEMVQQALGSRIEGEEESSIASTTMIPSAVFMAVKREAETMADLSDPSVVVDAALFTTFGEEVGEEESLLFASASVPDGYTSQVVDLTLTSAMNVDTLTDETLREMLDSDDRIPAPTSFRSARKQGIRLTLLTTTSKKAAAMLEPGDSVWFHEAQGRTSPSSPYDADGVTGGGDGERFMAPGTMGYITGFGSSKEEQDRHKGQLVEMLQEAMRANEQLANSNTTLQKQLAIYFSLRHSDDDKDKVAAAAAAAMNRSSAAAAAFAAADKEKRYREQLDIIALERDKLRAEHIRSETTSSELQRLVAEKEGKSAYIQKSFAAFKHEIAHSALHSQTGRPIGEPEVTRFETMERDKDIAVGRVQLQHIHLSTQVARLEEKLKKREQVADGLAMIDFEQLKIENSTLNEKIEDRNEELSKLRKKATVAVQVLTHVREKLHFVGEEATRLSNELGAVDSEVSEQRSLLTTAKKEKEQTRLDNEKARHAQGFAQTDKLAIDFERRKREVMALRSRIEALQTSYTQLGTYVATTTQGMGIAFK